MNGYWVIRIAVLSMILFGCRHHHDDPVSVPVVPSSPYTDNGNGTITDNTTGLMWHKEYNGRALSSTEADGFCAGVSLANFTDWRLPSDLELMTIVDYSTTAPAINGTYFQNTRFDYPWWTSTVEKSSSFFKGTWGVAFETGDLDTYQGSGYARCVRGGKDQPRFFVSNGNGTITDEMSGLMWQQQDEGTTVVWEDAITRCEKLTLGGYTDWRLPNIKELRSLADTTTYAPAIDSGYFPTTRTDSYWSSTIDAANPDTAWLVNFWHGEVTSTGKADVFFVRCVRGGE